MIVPKFEYLEVSIGGPNQKMIKLKDLPEYKYYEYSEKYPEFFEYTERYFFNKSDYDAGYYEDMEEIDVEKLKLDDDKDYE